MPPPVLLRLPLGGTCDGTGSLTVKSIVPSRSFYSAFTGVFRASGGGNPHWTLDVLSFPLGSADGSQVSLGPYVTAPEEVLTLRVTGARPGALVSGSLFGFFADSPEGLPLGLPAGGSFTLQAPSFGPIRKLIVTQNGQISGSASSSFDLDDNTVGIVLDALSAANLTNVTLVDNGNGRTLFAGVPGSGVNATALFLLAGPTTGGTFTITVTGGGGGTTPQVAVWQVSQFEVMTVRGALAAAGDFTTNMVDRALRILGKETKDQNRTPFSLSVVGAAGVVVEAMLTLNLSSPLGSATSANTSFGPPVQTIWRIQQMVLSMKLGAAALNTARFHLRSNNVGATIATSPIAVVAELTPQAALANAGAELAIDFPDGLELQNPATIGVSHIAGVNTIVESVSLVGFAYS